MTDFLTPAERSDRMSRIRDKDTQPELALRRVLHRLGLRYRLHGAGLPGKPDLVFPRYKTVVFVHGCFWHRHPDCKIATTPKSNTQFWKEKFEKNILRDAQATIELQALGWRVLVVWECDLTSAKKARTTGEHLNEVIRQLAPEKATKISSNNFASSRKSQHEKMKALSMHLVSSMRTAIPTKR